MRKKSGGNNNKVVSDKRQQGGYYNVLVNCPDRISDGRFLFLRGWRP